MIIVCRWCNGRRRHQRGCLRYAARLLSADYAVDAEMIHSMGYGPRELEARRERYLRDMEALHSRRRMIAVPLRRWHLAHWNPVARVGLALLAACAVFGIVWAFCELVVAIQRATS